MKHSLSDLQVQHLATVTHGFVGADLAALCNEAALVCIRRYHKFTKVEDEGYFDDVILEPILSKDEKSISGVCSKFASSSLSDEVVADNADIYNYSGIRCRLKIVFEDFEMARMKVRPSAMREVCLPFFFCLDMIMLATTDRSYYAQLLVRNGRIFKAVERSVVRVNSFL